MANRGELITLGRVGKTHGIKGWLRLYSYTDPPDNLADYRRFWIDREGVAGQLELDQVAPQGDHLVGHFTGYDDPEAAQRLVGAQLQVAAEELPELDSGEFYWHQLLGLAVINQEGQLLGRVARLMETGANDILVVRPVSGSLDDHERLIPYLQGSVIRRVDLDEGQILVEWVADYLI